MRTRRRGLNVVLALALLSALELLATPSSTAHMRPPTPETSSRELETRLLGPEHAAEHAAQRRWQQRWQQMSPAARRRWSALRMQALQAPAIGPPAKVGTWYEPGPGATPFLLPDYAIHAALLATGKVMLWGYPVTPKSGLRPNVGNAWLWDPAAGYGPNAFTRVPPPDKAPIYCVGESLLANGNLFIAGGNLDLEESKGLDKTFTFNPFNETWHRQANLAHGRWYPGQVVLPDGRVAILGGYSETGESDDNTSLELWPRRDLSPPNTANIDAEHLPVELISSAERTTALYPHLILTPAGKILLAGPGATDSALLDPGSFTWNQLDNLPGRLDRIGGNAVLLPGGARVLQIGGYDFTTYEKLKTSRAVSSTASMATNGQGGWNPDASSQSVGRAYGNTVLLPDESMVTIGGSAGRARDADGGTSWTDGDDPRLKTVELYDPRTRTWRVGPSQQRFRTYHSIALLLPDGSVLSAGDDTHEDMDRPNSTWIGSAEIYRPPYFFKGARPSISAAPATVRLGQSFAVSTPDTSSIDHAVLMAPSATTHGADMTQRLIRLPVARRYDGQGVALAVPANANAAPPGYYMLFLMNATGVPSRARWVRVLPQAAARSLAQQLNGPSISPLVFPAAARGAPGTLVWPRAR